MTEIEHDELGAHVSAQGGVSNAPARARAIDSVVLQLFTKQPSRWAEPKLTGEEVESFKAARAEHGIAVAGSHDSYLINLSSPEGRMRGMSRRSFQAELERCTLLELDFLVTHPGNATDGDLTAGLERNADGLMRCLEAVDGPTRVLLELTAGSGTTVGASFENLRAIFDQIPDHLQHRLGICFDTCHAYSAGYDLVNDYEGVWESFDQVLGLERLRLIHLNDSRHPFASRKDRHEAIGEGTLGAEPFRKIMLDDRLRSVPKVLETPKGDDPVAQDLENLGRLRGFRAG